MITTSIMKLWESPNPVSSPILARLYSAVRIPISLVTTTLDTGLLGISTPLNMLTLGKVKLIYQFNLEQSWPISSLPSRLFLKTLCVFNPVTEVVCRNSSEDRLKASIGVTKQKVAVGNFGIISEVVNIFFREKTKNMRGI